MRSSLALVTALLALPGTIDADDRAASPAPGVRYQRRSFVLGGVRTRVHVLSVNLCEAGASLRVTAPGERGLRVSSWARRVGAVAAINGDYFDTRSLTPLGPVRGGGHWWTGAAREHRDALLLADAHGHVSLLDSAGGEERWWDAERRVNDQWSEVLGARERVLINGRVHESPAISGRDRRHPRTAVGLDAARTRVYLVVVEGRGEEGSGATARQLGGILLALGAHDGVKLDGGGSSAMYVARRGVVNHPSDGHERAVATHLGVVLTRGGGGSPRCPRR